MVILDFFELIDFFKQNYCLNNILQGTRNVVHLDESGFHLLSSIEQLIFQAIPLEIENFYFFFVFA